jgi:hypothetical protein
MADPYGLNPLAEQIKERDALKYDQVAAVKAPPKLFANGTADYPAFTASGIDPQLLLRLPVGIRHAAAANPDIVQVHQWFEEYAGFPEAEIDHPGLRDARLRVEDWLDNTDLDTRTPEQRAADDEAEYLEYYGPTKDRLAHAAEQKRRAAAGEKPLDDFDDIQARKDFADNVQRSQADDVNPLGLSEASLRQLADLVNGTGA